MKIALAQMRIFPGEPEKNFESMKTYIADAKKEMCSIIAFPEMCISGYLSGDKWLDQVWCEYLLEFNERIAALSDGIAVIYGNVYLDNGKTNKDGRIRKYNVAYCFYNGLPVKNRSDSGFNDVAVKTLLPNYRIFDDGRYFFSLQDLSIDKGVPLEELLQPFEIEIDSKKITVGVEICEDLWFNDYSYKGNALNVTGMLINHGAEMIFNLSSSPWTYGKNQARNNRIRDSFRDAGRFVPFFYVNCVGMQNCGKNIVVFDGDSAVYNKDASIVHNASDIFKEELLVFNTGLKKKPAVKKQISAIESKYRAIIEGIRGMDTILGSSAFPYIIGISGGIDSALVACLLEQAAGAARVISFNLPTKYNSSTTKSIASNLAKKLGIEYHIIPVEQLSNDNTAALSAFSPSEFNCENIQAKIRGTSILSNVAGILNGLLVCNGNKVEIALGYATLYGDVNGGISPIGDLLKTEVFEMADFMNREVYKDTVISESLIPDEYYGFVMPPSAELKNNQIDPMKWGYHDILVKRFTDYNRLNPETVLEWYDNGSICEKLPLSSSIFDKYNLGNPQVFVDDLEWFVRSMSRAVFKRIQSPPIIILSKGAYGYDIRESQLPSVMTAKYIALKEKILHK